MNASLRQVFFKAPGSKHQAPEKSQAPNFKPGARVDLELEVWSFFGAWSLKFGASASTDPRNPDKLHHLSLLLLIDSPVRTTR
jgi:hypothetical protein